MLQSGHDTQQEARTMIATAGLRPTRQRIAVASLLIASEHGRVTAEIVYHEARDLGFGVSRATVCNTLRAFAGAGLLRRVPGGRSRKAWFCRRPSKDRQVRLKY
jgi:Fur family transcriptional regulator, iron response regulator